MINCNYFIVLYTEQPLQKLAEKKEIISNGQTKLMVNETSKCSTVNLNSETLALIKSNDTTAQSQLITDPTSVV